MTVSPQTVGVLRELTPSSLPSHSTVTGRSSFGYCMTTSGSGQSCLFYGPTIRDDIGRNSDLLQLIEKFLYNFDTTVDSFLPYENFPSSLVEYVTGSSPEIMSLPPRDWTTSGSKVLLYKQVFVQPFPSMKFVETLVIKYFCPSSFFRKNSGITENVDRLLGMRSKGIFSLFVCHL